jgi:phosphoglycerate dehydrogenase-like enzyme
MNTVLVVAHPAAQFLKVLDRLPDRTHLVVGNREEIFREAAPGADVLLHALGPKDVLQAVFARAEKLRWVHSMSAGLDGMLFPELISSPVPLTNGRGVFSPSLGEWVAGAILYFAKDFRRLMRSQQAGRWDQFDCEMVEGKTVGIVGMGTIGEEVAKRMRPFGVSIAALRRRPELSGAHPLVDRVYGPAMLADLLAASDYVVLSTPLTAETRGLIGARELAAMKPSGVLINVGRGPVVDEAALVAALRDNRIRGAALDVFEVEPLPEAHAFYSLENVLLSPHSADHVPGWSEKALEFFVENYRRFAAGQPLLNVVDKNAGY